MNGVEDIAFIAIVCRHGPARRGCRFLLVQQFMFYFLMIPLLVRPMLPPTASSARSSQRTLEPLLATPMTVTELLLGKAARGAHSGGGRHVGLAMPSM